MQLNLCVCRVADKTHTLGGVETVDDVKAAIFNSQGEDTAQTFCIEQSSLEKGIKNKTVCNWPSEIIVTVIKGSHARSSVCCSLASS